MATPAAANPTESVDPVDPATPSARTADGSSLPETMPAVVARGYGTPDVLERADLPIPTPGPDQVLVEVGATSLNALDWHFTTGTPYFLRLFEGLRRPRRLVPGADMAGTVVAIGGDVTDFVVGDRVYGETPGGGCATHLAVGAAKIAHLPDSVSFESGGATPVAGLTAVQALRTHADVQPGEHVLVNGAAGGVGTFTVQIAKALGATVTAVGSSRNVELVRSLGADEVIAYDVDDFVAGGRRFDVMIDNVGSRTPAENLSVLRPEGRYVAVSGPKGNPWLDPVPYVVRMAWATWRSDASFHQFTASPNRDDLDYLATLLDDGRLVPQIDRVVGLDGVWAGLAEIGTGHARAKIVIVPGAA